MIYNPEDCRAELEEAIKDQNAPRIAWVLVKLVRHGRVRCRNNKALNNYMAKVFPELRFQEVQKTVEYGPRKGQTYTGLRITDPAENLTAEESDETASD